MNPLDTFITQIEREMKRITGMVMAGSCPDYVTYRELVGQHKALEATIETAKKVFSGDEDDSAD